MSIVCWDYKKLLNHLHIPSLTRKDAWDNIVDKKRIAWSSRDKNTGWNSTLGLWKQVSAESAPAQSILYSILSRSRLIAIFVVVIVFSTFVVVIVSVIVRVIISFVIIVT